MAPENPPAENLAAEQPTADLHKVNVEAPGGWKFGMESTSGHVGHALAWLVVVAVAIGAAYAADRLSVSLAMSNAVTLVLALIAAVVILPGGGYVVTRKGK